MWSGFDFLDTLCKTICTSIYLGVVSLGDRICPAAWLRPCRREVSMTKTRPGLVCSDLQKLIRQAAEPSSGSICTRVKIFHKGASLNTSV